MSSASTGRLLSTAEGSNGANHGGLGPVMTHELANCVDDDETEHTENNFFYGIDCYQPWRLEWYLYRNNHGKEGGQCENGFDRLEGRSVSARHYCSLVL